MFMHKDTINSRKAYHPVCCGYLFYDPFVYRYYTTILQNLCFWVAKA
ncbi:hypothetical protein HMPREF9151_00663 [Hoylesella saccharolytica F0055]|uniref:Uncharacterized protein n=1 Tax=Hoylesella saccharolytica F0055 TaxID=1127699 RepID=L1NHR3_9BACT|nr:hypothetical protein HMPREF9151_00663 [Hoylesella saccharolytica F0055]